MYLNLFKSLPTLSMNLRQLKTKVHQYKTGLFDIPEESSKTSKNMQPVFSPPKISKWP